MTYNALETHIMPFVLHLFVIFVARNYKELLGDVTIWYDALDPEKRSSRSELGVNQSIMLLFMAAFQSEKSQRVLDVILNFEAAVMRNEN